MSNLQQLEARLDKRFEKVDKQFDDLTVLMSNFANDVSSRFDAVDARFDKIEEQLREQNEKYDHLVSTIDGFVKRIGDYAAELVARDHKIERLERWIQQLAQNAKVELT